MKIGILLTDELREKLRDSYVNYAQMFMDLLDKQGFQFTVYDVRNGEYPADSRECDGYLITGSRHGVYEDLPWLPAFFAFICRLNEEKIPLVGVCFGHEAVAKALGGKVGKSSRGWGVGVHTWRVCQQAEWMTPAQDDLQMLCVHQDQVESLPPHATVLAGSDFCPVAAYAIDEHIFCVQGHPEFTPDYVEAILDLVEQIPPAVRDEARQSLQAPMNREVCAEWIVRFFQRAQKSSFCAPDAESSS